MTLRARKSAAPPIEEIAGIVQRLAVLLSAGVSPVSAWGYLLPESDGSARVEDSATAIVRAAAMAGPQGESVADAIADKARSLGGQAGSAWLGLAAAWAVATAAGAPLAACLRQLAAAFRDAGQVHRDLQVALAGPAATARLVMALPVVGVVFGALLGFDTLATLFTTAPGLLCLGIGTALMIAGDRWNHRLVRGARVSDPAPGLALELAAIAMAGGGSAANARNLVRSVQERYGDDGATSAHRSAGPQARDASDAVIAAVLRLSERAGVPAMELLRSEAEQLRRDARGEGQRKAATLSVTLMLPLAVCVLPAFLLVGVAPLLLSVVSSTFQSF